MQNRKNDNPEKREAMIPRDQLVNSVLPKFRMAIIHFGGDELVFIPAKVDDESYCAIAYCYDIRSNSYSEAHCAFMNMFGMSAKEVADVIIMESLENATDNNRIHLGAYGIVFKEQIAEASKLMEELIEEELLENGLSSVKDF